MNGCGHGNQQLDRAAGRQLRVAPDVRETLPAEVFEHDEDRLRFGVNVVHRNQSRMMKLCRQSRLAQKRLPHGGVAELLLIRHLDRDLPVQVRIDGQIDCAETAASQIPLDAVSPQLLVLDFLGFVRKRKNEFGVRRRTPSNARDRLITRHSIPIHHRGIADGCEIVRSILFTLRRTHRTHLSLVLNQATPPGWSRWLAGFCTTRRRFE